MDFEYIIGNDPVKASLKAALAARSLPNTLLFLGPDGIGKGLFARALAVLLMGTEHNRELTEHKVSQGNHPDLHEYFPEGKAQMHSIQSMRELIGEIGKAPFEGRSKVFIIHDADRMLPTSANALLKTLEEPALDSYIILLTSSAAELLPTIVSRCRTFNFSHIPEEQIASFLAKEHQKTVEQSQLIAKMAHGSMAKAIEMIQHPEQDEKRQVLFDLLTKAPMGYSDLHQILARLESLYEKGGERKEVEILLSQILMWYRDLHLLNAGADPKALYFPELSQKTGRQDIPGMPKILKAVDGSRLGCDRGLKLSVCFERLFFDLGLVF